MLSSYKTLLLNKYGNSPLINERQSLWAKLSAPAPAAANIVSIVV